MDLHNVSWPGFFTAEITPADGVFFLIIHDRHRTTFFPCDCEETKIDILYKWVKEHWGECNSDKPITDFTQGDAIHEYFDGNDDEHWDSDYARVYNAEDVKEGRVSMRRI